MADFAYRSVDNVPGKYYVDDQCLDCDLCRETAPTVFMRSEAKGYSFVARQPQTEEERALCDEAVYGCPCEAIGDDGERNDWESPIKTERPEPQDRRACGHCQSSASLWERIRGFFRR